MAKKHKYPIDRIRQMASEGMSLTEIARQLNVSYDGVRWHAKKNGIKTDYSWRKGYIRSKYPVNEIRRMIEVEGMTFRQVAESIPECFSEGISETTAERRIRYVCDQNGIDTSRAKTYRDPAAYGEERVMDGELYIKLPDHQSSRSDGWVKKKIVIVEESLGRQLHPWEKIRYGENADPENPKLEDLHIPRTKRITHCENCQTEVRLDRWRFSNFDRHFCGRNCSVEYFRKNGRGNRRLSNQEVVLIREAMNAGIPASSVADQFGISNSYAHQIFNGVHRKLAGGPIKGGN